MFQIYTGKNHYGKWCLHTNLISESLKLHDHDTIPQKKENIQPISTIKTKRMLLG
jgi:hypothetical protein